MAVATALLLAALTGRVSAQQTPPVPVGPAYPVAPPYPYSYAYPSAAPLYFGRFYFRADGGGAFETDHTYYRSENSLASNTVLFPYEHFRGGVGNSQIFDIGVGSQPLPFFRWDATLSYLPSLNFSGTDNFGAGSLETAQIHSLVGLLNGYLQLDGLFPYVFGPFQPYLDMGLGAASNHQGAFDSTLLGGTITGDTRTSAAFAVGAGVGWPITRNITLDLAYRYLDLGTMRTGSPATVAGAATIVQPVEAGLQVSTVTLGVRFTFP